VGRAVIADSGTLEAKLIAALIGSTEAADYRRVTGHLVSTR